jgi:hypothetical protein
MVPTFAFLVNNGDKKDRNGDGLVCAKPAPCQTPEECSGSRDYELFGPPLLGIDGALYYVTDNVTS